MTEKIKLEFSFEGKSRIVEKDSSEMKAYTAGFETRVKPAMQEIEKRKSRAQEKAATIRVTGSLSDT